MRVLSILFLFAVNLGWSCVDGPTDSKCASDSTGPTVSQGPVSSAPQGGTEVQVQRDLIQDVITNPTPERIEQFVARVTSSRFENIPISPEVAFQAITQVLNNLPEGESRQQLLNKLEQRSRNAEVARRVVEATNPNGSRTSSAPSPREQRPVDGGAGGGQQGPQQQPQQQTAPQSAAQGGAAGAGATGGNGGNGGQKGNTPTPATFPMQTAAYPEDKTLGKLVEASSKGEPDALKDLEKLLAGPSPQKLEVARGLASSNVSEDLSQLSQLIQLLVSAESRPLPASSVSTVSNSYSRSLPKSIGRGKARTLGRSIADGTSRRALISRQRRAFFAEFAQPSQGLMERINEGTPRKTGSKANSGHPSRD